MVESSAPVRTIRIAVSACLLGEEVRYDGGHRRSSYVSDALGAAFELVPECPEVGIGLGVPRPKIRLEETPGGVRLLGADGGDLTGTMTVYAEEAAGRFREVRVAGVVLKARSPSCGIGDARLHRDGTPITVNAEEAVAEGVFAGEVARGLPLLPRISEEEIENPSRRDHWLTQVFASHELGRLGGDEQTLAGFHKRWRTTLAAHSEDAAHELDEVVAAGSDAERTRDEYRTRFLTALAEPPSNTTHGEALRRLAESLDYERNAALEADITAFATREVALAVPIRSLRHEAMRRGVTSLANDAYLASRPAALGYRETIYPE